MSTDQWIRVLLSAQPFRPFRIRTVDGQIFRVPRPEWASVSPDGGAAIFVWLNKNAGTLVDTSRITELELDELSPAEVLEVLPNAHRSHARRRDPPHPTRRRLVHWG
jgi:hypothetical protein